MWAIIAAVIAVAASAGVYYQQRKMEAQAKKQAQEAKAVQISGHDSNRGLYTVYGKALVGSTTVWKKVSDKQTRMTQTGFTTFSRGTGDLINGTRDLKSNRFLYRAVSLCAGPIQSVENILIDDEGYQSSRFGQGDNRHFAAAVSLGPTAGQNFSAMRTSYSDFNAWGTSFTGKGVAYAIERLYLDNDKPAYQGEPSTKYLVKGRKLYDPRKDSTSSVYDATLGTSSHRFDTPSTWEWSDNPVLALLDYMTNSEYGRGLALSVIDLPSIADSADKCDVLVDIPARLTNTTGSSYDFYDPESGQVITVPINTNIPNYRPEQGSTSQQKRFRINIAIDPSKELLDNIQEILNVFRGNLSYANGKYRVHMADVASPVLTIGDDDIITGLKISNGDRAQRMNRATVKFINANKQHKTDQASWPSLDSNEDDGLYDTFVTEDQGEKLHKTFTIKGCTDFYQAQDTAEFLVRDSRSNLTVAGTFGSRCFGLVPGDIVSLTYDSAGYSGKYFRVMQVAIDLTSMNVNLQLKEYDSSVYTWNDARGNEPEGLTWQEEVVNASPTTPVIGTLSSTTRTRADGSTALTLTVPFSNIPEQAQYVDVEWGISGTDQYNSQVVFDTENINQVEVPIERDNATYAVRVRYFIADSAGTLMASTFATDTIAVGNLTGTKLGGIEEGATANNIYQQASEPTGGTYNDGDIWIDTDDGYRMYLRSGGAWVDRADTRIATAITDAAGAQSTADGKVVTFYQDGEPAASSSSTGDLWIDTNDNNKLYRYNGSSWDSVRDSGIASAISAAATAQSTADGKIVTFYQNDEPAGASSSTGDLWFDTNDNNKLYRYNGTDWVSARDSGIAAAISAAAGAQSTADGKVVTFYQDGEPAAASSSTGDLWIDTNDNNKLYRFNGATWDSVRDAGIASAISSAATAQSTADGKIVTFYQASAPAAASSSTGDLWFDTDDDNKLYRYNGSAWVSARDAGIADALANAATAQSTADGKIVTFYQNAEPSTGSEGDLWIDTNDDNKLYRYDGSSWNLARDSGIASAISDAATAQSTADGKVTTFYASSSSTPTPEGTGDLWYQTDTQLFFRYNGSAWQEVASYNTGDLADLDTVGTTQIDDDAVTIDKIANTLQSTNYSAGSAGWKLTTDGTFEAGNGTFRGALTATSLTLDGTSIAEGQLAQGVQDSLDLADTATQNDTAFAAKIAWGFDSDAQGWVAAYGTITHNSDGYVLFEATTNDPMFIKNGLSIDGGKDHIVRVRIKRVAGSSWQGTLYYGTTVHGDSESYRKTISDTTVTNEWVVLEYDMSSLSAGGTDWVDNTITRLRFDWGNSSTDDFQIDWIAIGTKGAAPVREGGEIISGSVGGVTITDSKLYQGTGTYNNTNTGFYLDSSGNFSLKNKLSFDGTTLAVDGNVTVDEFVKAGSGSTAAVMSGRSADNFAFWAGADFDANGGASGGNAPFRVTRAGKVIMTNFALYSESGQKLFDSTDGLLGLPSTQVAVSTGSLVPSVSDELTSQTDYFQMVLNSTQTITAAFDYPLNYLFSTGTSEADAYGKIATSITVTIQKSTDASTWTTFGSATFTKTDSSSPSSSQYYVLKQTVDLGYEFGGGTLYFASLQPGGAVDDGNVISGSVSASLGSGTHYLRMQVSYGGSGLAATGYPSLTENRSVTLTTSGAGFTVDSSGNVSDGVSTSATTGWVLSNFVEKTESDNVTINGTLTLGGDLVVNGTTTTINSTTLTVDDKNIVLADGAANAAAADGAGITINGPTGATFTYDATNDRFVSGKNLYTASDMIADQFYANNNGAGQNYKIGDDAWIGDINVANTFRISGVQNSNNGYITFGNSSNTALGRAGTGVLTWGGNEVLTTASSSYNNSNWNTAYTYSQVGHLPLAGGTLSGGLTTSGVIAHTANEGREVQTYMPSSYTTGDLVAGHEYGWYSDHWRVGMTRSGNTAGDDFVIQWNGTRKFDLSKDGNATFTGSITSNGSVYADGDLVLNSNNSGAKYLYLKRPVGSDGHILFQEGQTLRWQNKAGTDLNWYSYTAAATTFQLGGSGGANLIVGDYKINGTSVIDGSRNLHNLGYISIGDTTTATIDDQTDYSSPLVLRRTSNAGKGAIVMKGSDNIGTAIEFGRSNSASHWGTYLDFLVHNDNTSDALTHLSRKLRIDANGLTAYGLVTATGNIYATSNIIADGYFDLHGFLYSRSNLAVLNAAGTGWNTWATRSNGAYNLNVGTISSGAITSSGVITGTRLNLTDSDAPYITFTEGSNVTHVGLDGGAFWIRQNGLGGGSEFVVNADGTVNIAHNATFGGTISSGAITTSGDLTLSGAGKRLYISGGSSPGWSAPVIWREGTQIAISDYSGVALGGYDGTAYGARLTVSGPGDVNVVQGALKIGGTTLIDNNRLIQNASMLTAGYLRITGNTAVSNTTNGLFMDANYTNGQYRHRWRKQDVGGGVPLYLDYAAGTANSYTTIARFGPYSGNTQVFEAYGNAKVTGTLETLNTIYARKDGAGLQEVARFSNYNTNQHALYLSVDDDNNVVQYQSSGSSAGGHRFVMGNDTWVTMYPGYTYFNGLDLSISGNNAANGAGTYFRGNSTHFVLGLTNGNTFYCNYGNSAGAFRLDGANFYWNSTSILDSARNLTNIQTISANGSVSVNDDASGNYYLYLKKPVGGDGHLLFQEGSSLKWQNYSTNDLYWYSYTAGQSTFRLKASGGVDAMIGSYHCANVDVLNSNGALKLRSESGSHSNAFVAWNTYNDTTNNPANSWWYGMRVSHGDAMSYYSATIGINFFSDEVYLRRMTGGSSQGWRQFALHNQLATFSEVRSTGNVTAYYSDERLKDFHGRIDSPLEKIKALGGYYFTENEKAKELGYDNDQRQVGVNAQEVHAVLPEVVDIAPISHQEGVDEEYLTVHYDKMVPLLIEAIKEQQEQIEKLQAMLKEITNGDH